MKPAVAKHFLKAGKASWPASSLLELLPLRDRAAGDLPGEGFGTARLVALSWDGVRVRVRQGALEWEDLVLSPFLLALPAEGREDPDGPRGAPEGAGGGGLWAAHLTGSGLSCCLEGAGTAALDWVAGGPRVLAQLQEQKWPERCPECCCRKAEPVSRAGFWQQGW